VVRFTRVRDLLLVAVLVGLLTHVVFRQSYQSIPPLPTLAGSTLLVLAIVEAVLGFSLRARILRRRGTRPVQPLTAARAVALAKASSVLGAIMLGVWGGVLGYVLPRRSQIIAAGSDTTAAVIGSVCAMILVGAALWLEYCCKAPKGPDDADEPDRK
jgi:DMSO reductase anchor subunit